MEIPLSHFHFSLFFFKNLDTYEMEAAEEAEGSWIKGPEFSKKKRASTKQVGAL